MSLVIATGTKTATTLQSPLLDAASMTAIYAVGAPELLTVGQIFSIVDRLHRIPGATGNLSATIGSILT